jgi:hypothetical protein
LKPRFLLLALWLELQRELEHAGFAVPPLRARAREYVVFLPVLPAHPASPRNSGKTLCLHPLAFHNSGRISP